MSPQDYEVVIRPLSAAEGGGFLATVSELPGCKSDGATPEQALANAYAMIGCWIAAAGSLGMPVPRPRPPAGRSPRTCPDRAARRKQRRRRPD